MDTESEPQGCLTVVLKLFGIHLKRNKVENQESAYCLRADFLSTAELSFYRVLRLGIGDRYCICPKVNLSDLFFVPKSEHTIARRNQIDRKHVDFLLCDPATLRPIAGIELDDSSHTRTDRKIRDELVDRVFETACLPLLRVTAATGYNPQTLSELVNQVISKTKPLPPPKYERGESPICRKCGAKMVIRKAKQGPRPEKEFWGCPNFPKCRETMNS